MSTTKMKIIKVISEHKKNKKKMKRDVKGMTVEWDKPLWSAKIGHAQCIVEINGELLTRHIPINV